MKDTPVESPNSPDPPVRIAEKPLLTMRDTALLLGVCLSTARKWQYKHGLPVFQIFKGGESYVRRKSLEAWLELRERASNKAG